MYQLYIDPLNFFSRVVHLFNCPRCNSKVPKQYHNDSDQFFFTIFTRNVLLLSVWEFVWKRERVRYVLAARIHSQRAHNSFGKQPAFGQPKLNCIRIAKINMFSFEMCHKITSEKKWTGEKWNEKKWGEWALFTHAKVIRTSEQRKHERTFLLVCEIVQLLPVHVQLNAVIKRD